MIINMFPLKDEVKNDIDVYANAIAKVKKYCFAVNSIELTPPQVVPDWYNEAAKNVSTASANASAWDKIVVSNLLQVPKSIVQWKPIYKSKMVQIQQDMRNLANSLSDTTLRSSLIGKLSALEDTLNLQINAITHNIQMIEDYAGKFELDLEHLSQVTKQAEEDEKTDKEKIKDVKNEIFDIEHRIAQYDTWITVGEAMLGGGLAVVALAYTIDPVVGIVFIVFSVVAAVGAVDIVALEICKSVANSKLNEKEKELNEYEQAVTSLALIHSSVQKALDSSKELIDAVHGMAKIWEKLLEFAQNIRSALENEKTVLSKETLLSAVNSLQTTEDTTNCYFDLAEKLASLSYTNVERKYEEPVA